MVPAPSVCFGSRLFGWPSVHKTFAEHTRDGHGWHQGRTVQKAEQDFATSCTTSVQLWFIAVYTVNSPQRPLGDRPGQTSRACAVLR